MLTGPASLPRSLLAGMGGMLLLCLMGLVAPLHFWGIHFAAYLPAAPLLVPVLCALGLSLGWLLYRLPQQPARISPWIVSLILAAGMYLLFQVLTIATVYYGDSKGILVASQGPGFQDKFYPGRFLSPHVFSVSNGEHFTYSLVVTLHQTLGIPIETAFRQLSCLAGFLYVLLWMQFIQRQIRDRRTQVLAAALVLSSGMMQVFYGHVEVYCFPMLSFSALLITGLRLLEKPDRKTLILSILLLFLAIRTHAAGYIFVPWLAWVLWQVRAHSRQGAAVSPTSGGRSSLWVLAGTLLAGVLGYIFLFDLGGEAPDAKLEDRNPFLTLLPAGGIDNHYAMLSPWHIWDYVQILLYGSVAGMALLGAAAWRWLRGDRPQVAALTAAVLALVLMAALMFAIDPKLSMPRDFDLNGLAAPAMLLTAVLLLRHYGPVLTQPFLALFLTLCTLQAVTPVLNHLSLPVHTRVRDLGIHIFRTQKGGSAFLIRNIGAPWFSAAESRVYAVKALETCLPWAREGDDQEYGFLAAYTAGLFAEAGMQEEAIRHYETAERYDADNLLVKENLAICCFNTRQYARAAYYAQQSRQAGSQNVQVAVIGLLAHLHLNQEEEALRAGEDYLARFGDPQQIGGLVQALRQGARAADVLARVQR